MVKRKKVIPDELISKVRRRITKFKSRNLLGETKKEEKRRISKVISRAIVLGRTPVQVRNISSLSGATSTQLKRRRKILKKAGLSGQKVGTVKERGFI